MFCNLDLSKVLGGEVIMNPIFNSSLMFVFLVQSTELLAMSRDDPLRNVTSGRLIWLIYFPYSVFRSTCLHIIWLLHRLIGKMSK